ncbi:MAG: hypothetical protein M4D80_32130 [Myxococcota bacterium]|nr:hypothetical protein [Myxococcota bacterium]
MSTTDPLAQHELPGRAPLPDAVVYTRRGRVFVLIAALFVASAVILPFLGFSRLYGMSWVVRELGREPPVPLLLPLGAIAFPVALLALNLAGGLYGIRRARGLLLAGCIVWGGVLGLLWAMDHIPAYDNTTTNAFWLGLALVACGVTTCAVQIEVFSLARRARGVRQVLSSALGVAAGWGVFALLERSVPMIELPPDVQIEGVAIGAGGFVWIVVVLGSIPVALVARGLSVYLRVALREEYELVDTASSEQPAFVVKPQALIVDTPVPGRLRKRPFTTQELAFFDAGDELSTKTASDSFNDLRRKP